MDDIESSDKEYFDKIKSRDYKCPCGKAYLSYPALFTHIKQKHQGKPPGKVIKPGPNNSKRGRPSLKNKSTKDNEIIIKINQQNAGYYFGGGDLVHYALKQKNQQQINKKKCLIQKLLNEISIIVDDLPPLTVKKQQINQIQAYTEMLVIINRYEIKCNMSQKVTVAQGLIQFLKLVSQKVQWKKFQQLYILFMLFLQFIIDEENNKNILRTASMDILCQYINEFYQNHLHALAEYYEVSSMQILRQDLIISVFSILFNWMMIKTYTSYSISINCSSKCLDTQFQQFSNE